MHLPHNVKGEKLQGKLLPSIREFKAASKIDLSSDNSPLKANTITTFLFVLAYCCPF